MESNERSIDVRDFVPELRRIVVLPNGSQYPALWLDDITLDQFNTLVTEEQSATDNPQEAYAVMQRHVKLLVPSISDEDLASLTVRQLPRLCSDLKKFEGSDGDRPLETSAPAPSVPAVS